QAASDGKFRFVVAAFTCGKTYLACRARSQRSPLLQAADVRGLTISPCSELAWRPLRTSRRAKMNHCSRVCQETTRSPPTCAAPRRPRLSVVRRVRIYSRCCRPQLCCPTVRLTEALSVQQEGDGRAPVRCRSVPAPFGT